MRVFSLYRAALVGGALLLVILASGCANRAAGQPAGQAGVPGAAGASAAPTKSTATTGPEGATATGNVSANAAAVPTTAPPPPPTKPLFLEVNSPATDGSVTSAKLQVSGQTISDAVVSVDGDLVQVKSDGSFATQIQLQQGANDVEVMASDSQGNEKSVIRSVICEP